MRYPVILTTEEDGQIVEKQVGTTCVTSKTDLKALITNLAAKFFKGQPFNVRPDKYLFKFVAVDKNGDTITIGE